MTKITIDRATVEQALEALVVYSIKAEHRRTHADNCQAEEAITAMRQTLEQPNEFHPDWDQIKPFNDRIAELETVARQALEAMDQAYGWAPIGTTSKRIIGEAITALRQALEQPAQQEPVAWYLPSEEGCDSIFRDHRTVAACTGNKWEGFQPLYTHPPAIDKSAAIRIATALGWEPKREWVGLTDEEIDVLWRSVPNQALYEAVKDFAREVIEAYKAKQGERA